MVEPKADISEYQTASGAKMSVAARLSWMSEAGLAPCSLLAYLRAVRVQCHAVVCATDFTVVGVGALCGLARTQAPVPIQLAHHGQQHNGWEPLVWGW